MKIVKRDGKEVRFSRKKIETALRNAFKSVGAKYDGAVLNRIMANLNTYNDDGEGTLREKATVEEIQDIVEKELMISYPKVAKSFIIYREQHRELRDFVKGKEEFINRYKQSGNTADATIDDNSNVASKNIGILNNEIHKADNKQISRGMIMRKLKELYPDFDCKQYIKDLDDHIIYKHDESSFAGAIAPYCCSITMYPFLTDGIKGIGGLSAAPKNIDSFCGMYVNMIFAVSSQFAGAVATSEFLLYFDYFARKEWGDDYFQRQHDIVKPGKDLLKLLNLTHYWCTNIQELMSHDFGCEEYNTLRDEIVSNIKCSRIEENDLKEWTKSAIKGEYLPVKFADGTRTIGSQINQYFQQVIYSINQPAAARGMQSAFVNFSYFDKPFFESMFGHFYFPDGTQPMWESLSWLQKDFMQWFNTERLKTILTFPVESFALIYKDGEFADKDSANFVAEEYARGHSFFTYISDTADSLSSCCRLKNKVQTKEFNFTNGNMGVQTGSKSVITLNLNRITQNCYNEHFINLQDSGKACDIQDTGFYEYLKKNLNEILERVYKYHTAYNELLWDMYNANLLPVYKAGFIDLNKQYLTIGINGLNEAAEFLGMECNDNERYKNFCQTIFSTIKEANIAHKTPKTTYNTECVPAESLAVKNYNWDKADGHWVPEDRNLYASYIYVPSSTKESVLERIKLHGKEYIGDYLDGGSAAHINLKEHLSKEQYQHILKYAADNGCQYFTFNIPNSECKDCGFIAKTPFDVCPKCGSKHIVNWDRIIGYLTAIPQWSEGRRIEQKTRDYTSRLK